MPTLMTLRMRFPVCSFPFAAADAIGELRHLVEHGVDLRHDVLSVRQDGCPFGRAQGYVQDRALLREVDLVAAKHRVDVLAAGPIPRPAGAAA